MDLATRRVEGKPGVPAAGPKFSDNIRNRLIHSAVKLGGTGWDGQSSVNCSGVIYKVDKDYVYIVSAAHNIMVWAGLKKPPENWTGYIDGDQQHPGFKTRITISYGTNLTFNVAPSGQQPANIFSVKAPEVNFEVEQYTFDSFYDLIDITSKDSTLRAYAKKYVFADASYDEIAKTVADEAKEVAKSPSAFLDVKKHFYVQLGYGNNEDERSSEKVNNHLIQATAVTKTCERTDKNDNSSLLILKKNTLHYRLTTPSYKTIRSMFNQEAKAESEPDFVEYAEAICLTGRLSSTTAKGDSGGPLYAVSRTGDKAYLLGVTSGADYSIYNQTAEKMVSRRIFRNCVSTSVAPYWAEAFK
jgi:hypothetical protein